MDNTEIKTIIKTGLAKNNLTQAKLAALLGIERATVNRWCMGRAIPEADTFLRVCKILNIRLDQYLFDREDPLETQLLTITGPLSQRQKIALLRILSQMIQMFHHTTTG